MTPASWAVHLLDPAPGRKSPSLAMYAYGYNRPRLLNTRPVSGLQGIQYVKQRRTFSLAPDNRMGPHPPPHWRSRDQRHLGAGRLQQRRATRPWPAREVSACQPPGTNTVFKRTGLRLARSLGVSVVQGPTGKVYARLVSSRAMKGNRAR